MGVLDGKVALVTGPSKGIGAGIATGLAAASSTLERLARGILVLRWFCITQVLAKELGPKRIRVNSINPGGTETEGAHALGVMSSQFEKHLISQKAILGPVRQT